MYTHNGPIDYCQHLTHISVWKSFIAKFCDIFTIFFLFHNPSFILNSFQFPLFSLCS